MLFVVVGACVPPTSKVIQRQEARFKSQTKDWRSFDLNSTRPYQLTFTLFMRLSNKYIYKLSVSNDFAISTAYV